MSYHTITTETRNPSSQEIDTKSSLEIVKLMNDEDKTVARAVESQLIQIARTVDLIVEKLKIGGRLVYVGCGSSGRLAMMDAVECSVTYGVAEGTVVAVVAGGFEALKRSVENLEDNLELSIEDLDTIKISSNDIVVGITASGRTNYVIGALRYAKSLNCPTIALVCNENSPLAAEAQISICPVVGPEVITGSTRMKAGTAQKMVLNMLSTASMVRMGKCYDNLMVDLRANACKKLRDRAVRIMRELTKCDADEAKKLLRKADWHLKVAVIMKLLNIESHKEAETLLHSCEGSLKEALTFKTS